MPRPLRPIDAYVGVCARGPGRILLALLLVAAASALVASGLELRTDLMELLPEDHPAVVAVRRTTPR